MLINSLFIGLYPCGIVYADRRTEENRDYMKIAFLPYSTLQLDIYDKENDLLPLIREDAAYYQKRKGEQLDIGGLTIILGN